MLTLSINRLRISAYIGAHDDELAAPQTVFADIRLSVEADEAVRSDNLVDTVDYAVLASAIVHKTCAGRVFHLIEHLAGEIARDCLAFDARIVEAAVTVEKPSALPGLAASASATVVCGQPARHET